MISTYVQFHKSKICKGESSPNKRKTKYLRREPSHLDKSLCDPNNSKIIMDF